MAQPAKEAAAAAAGTKPRTSSRVSNALKSGVVYGGSAVLTAVNNITPHIAGAVDILVVEQPDGSRKATPFYVRFGKYTALRTRERNVKLYINDQLAPFGMHIGMYGQAYFATETKDIREGGDDDEQEALLAGMMSPPSGYSSGADDPPADSSEAGATLSAVRQRIDGIKDARRGSGRSSAGTNGGSRGPRVPLAVLGAGAGAGSSAQAAPGRTPAAPAAEERPSDGTGSKLSLQLQLAPALSMADRNESFVSARETLATPLGDDLVASILGAVSPALPASPERKPQRTNEQPQQEAQGQRQAAAGPQLRALDACSSNRLWADAASGGASPCGWSEDEEEHQRQRALSGSGAEAARQQDGKEGGSPGLGTGEAVDQQQQLQRPLPPMPGQVPQPQATVLAPQGGQQVQGQTHHTHSSVQQPLHQQLGFPENTPAGGLANSEPATTLGDTATADPASAATAPTSCDLDPGCTGPGGKPPSDGPKLHATVDWAQVLGPAAAAGPAPAPLPGPIPGPAAAPPPLPLPAFPPPAAPRSVPLDAPIARVACSAAVQRASPGAGCGALALPSAVTGDGCGPGSGPGSHTTVSLLSSSLRAGGASAGGGLAAAAVADGRPGGMGSGRPSTEWLRAKDSGEAGSTSAFLPLAAAASGGVAGLAFAGTAIVDSGALGPIAAAAGARPAGAAESAHARRPQAVWADELSCGQRSVTLSLGVTSYGEVRVHLAVVPTPQQQHHQQHQSQLLPVVASPTGAFPTEVAVSGGAGGGAGPAAVLPSRGELAGGSESGYLGDEEQGAGATAGTSVRQHHHAGHHHHYHYPHGHGHVYGHAHGHGHSRHDHNELLHSTSAPLPSSAIDALAAAAEAARAQGAVAAAGGAAGGLRAATHAHGIELSLCGSQLRPSMPYPEAIVLFDANRVSEEAFFSRFHDLSGSADLAIRLSNGVIFPCHPLSYSLLGLLAFGTWRLPPGTPCWAPEGADSAGSSEAAATSAAAAAATAMLAAAVARGAGVAAVAAAAAAAGDAAKGVAAGATASAASTPKKGQAATGSRWLWMFGTRRDGGRTSATGGGGGTSVTGRSPPLTSPIAERQGSVEHKPAAAASATAAVSASAAAAVAADAAPAAPPEGADGSTGGLPPAGGSTAGTVASQGDADQPPDFNVVTKKSLTASPAQLAVLPLKYGQNTIMYKVGAYELRAYVYFLPWRTRIVISDIDGTITKSDVLGHLLPAMGLDWSHPGIAELLTNIRHNNYLIMYLSSRSISQANITRDFINTLVQGEHRMPLGPVIISPHGLLPSLYREMILRRPHEFKIATLQDIRALFPSDWNPFYGGFGNRDTDEISYREVGVQPSRIFIINPRGELRQPVDCAPREGLPSSPTAAPSASAGTGAGATAAASAARPASADDVTASPGGAATADPPAEPAAASAASQPLVTAAPAVVPTRELSSKSVGSAAATAAPAGSVGRRASGSTTITAAAAAATATATSGSPLSTLSAINEFVHDIFPPLRNGEPITPASSADEKDVGENDRSRAGSRHSGEVEGGGARGGGGRDGSGAQQDDGDAPAPRLTEAADGVGSDSSARRDVGSESGVEADAQTAGEKGDGGQGGEDEAGGGEHTSSVIVKGGTGRDAIRTKDAGGEDGAEGTADSGGRGVVETDGLGVADGITSGPEESSTRLVGGRSSSSDRLEPSAVATRGATSPHEETTSLPDGAHVATSGGGEPPAAGEPPVPSASPAASDGGPLGEAEEEEMGAAPGPESGTAAEDGASASASSEERPVEALVGAECKPQHGSSAGGCGSAGAVGGPGQPVVEEVMATAVPLPA